MVTKPWYVKKPRLYFVRQKNQCINCVRQKDRSVCRAPRSPQKKLASHANKTEQDVCLSSRLAKPLRLTNYNACHRQVRKNGSIYQKTEPS
jgi:hypothetical protein